MSGIFERSSAQFGIFGNVAARLVLVAAAIFGCLAFAPQARAQSVVVTVSTAPAGQLFMVDGQLYWQARSFIWAVGSEHSLVVASLIQPNPTAPTVYTFQNWFSGGDTNTSPQIWTIADASVTQYTANFSVAYQFNVTTTCEGGPCSGVPGTVLLNGATMGSPGPTWYAAGTVLVLTAVPNTGYVPGWKPGANQVIAGGTDTVTMNGPVTADADFTNSLPITFGSMPQGLKLVVDGEPVTPPLTEPLGWG